MRVIEFAGIFRLWPLIIDIECYKCNFKLESIFQVHRGIKGIVKDEDGNGIKGATVSVRGIRHFITTGTNVEMIKYIELKMKCVLCIYDLDVHVISTYLISNQCAMVCLCLYLPFV